MQKLFIKIFYCLTLLFLFLPAFSYAIGTNIRTVYSLIIILFFITYMILYHHTFYKKFVLLCTKTTYKYLIIFLIYLVISSIILVAYGTFAPMLALKNLLVVIYLHLLPCTLISACFIPGIISVKRFLQFYFIAIFFIFIFGLVEYLGKICNISFINSVQQFIANERNFSFYGPAGIYTERLSSVFAEPGNLGAFIFLNIPIIYKIVLSKHKIFRNAILNSTIKISIIPLAWLNLIFTMSPIWLALNLIFIPIFFYKIIFKIIKKYNYIMLAVVLAVLFIFANIDWSFIENSKQFERIVKVLSNIHDFKYLASSEGSLSTRIFGYYQQIQVFLNHKLLGVGINNATDYVAAMYANSGIPLTPEATLRYTMYMNGARFTYNSSYLYTLLCETGFIGTCLYFLFLVMTYLQINKIAKLWIFKNNIIYTFIDGYRATFILYIFMSIYDTFLLQNYALFVVGLSVSIQYLWCKANNIICKIKTLQKIND